MVLGLFFSFFNLIFVYVFQAVPIFVCAKTEGNVTKKVENAFVYQALQEVNVLNYALLAVLDINVGINVNVLMGLNVIQLMEIVFVGW